MITNSEKAEMAILTKYKYIIYNTVNTRNGDREVLPKLVNKYQAITIDPDLNVKGHLECAWKKAAKKSSFIARIMPNIGKTKV